MNQEQRQHRSTFANELDDLIRGACGGFLFGIPLFYTMEVWWIGSAVTPLWMVAAIAVSYLVVLALNYTNGFRKTEDNDLIEAAIDSVEAIAIGIVCATLTLFVLQEISLETQLNEVIGKVIFESVPFSLGVALANQFLGNDANQSQTSDSNQSQASNSKSEDISFNTTLADLGATSVGGIILAFSIAPTDEVPMLAAAISGPWLLAMIALSLLISYGIVFEARFANQNKRRKQQGILQSPLSETIVCYLVSLLAAMMMLVFFNRLTFADPWSTWLRYTLILGLPATIGGAAGRLAI